MHAAPARTVQIFDSIFLHEGHALRCFDAEPTTHDPLQGWRAKKWANTLTERAAEAQARGDVVGACEALLMRALYGAPDAAREVPLVPPVGRILHHSAAANLRQLSHLTHVIQGVLACTEVEETKLQLDQKALIRMFHTYRVPILEYLTADASCNFEALRPTIQESFYAVIIDLRTQGVLTADARRVLETVADYMSLVETSVARQAAECDVRLHAELAALGGDAGKPPPRAAVVRSGAGSGRTRAHGRLRHAGRRRRRRRAGLAAAMGLAGGKRKAAANLNELLAKSRGGAQ